MAEGTKISAIRAEAPAAALTGSEVALLLQGNETKAELLSNIAAFVLSGATAAEVIRDVVAAALQAGTGITVTPDDAGNTITIATTAYRPGGADVEIADGGTGASTISVARTNLGLAIGSDVQAHSAALAAIAGLAPANDDLIQRKAGAWVNRTAKQVQADLNASFGPGVHVLGAGVGASHTGSTAETTLATVNVPAGAMGTNGRLRITTQWSYTLSANSKTIRQKLGGTAFLNGAVTVSTASLRDVREIVNANSAAAQKSAASSVGASSQASSGAPASGAVDTSVAVDLTITGQLGSAAETITLETYLVELIVPA